MDADQFTLEIDKSDSEVLIAALQHLELYQRDLVLKLRADDDPEREESAQHLADSCNDLVNRLRNLTH
jgi:hypothetical protein